MIGIALFGLAWLAGVGGTLATAFNIHALHTASEISQYLLPTDGLWQGAIYYLEPSSFVTQQLAGSPVGQGDPFLALAAPPWQYLAWAGIWLRARPGARPGQLRAPRTIGPGSHSTLLKNTRRNPSSSARCVST